MYLKFQLLKTMPILQNQIDALLEFQVKFFDEFLEIKKSCVTFWMFKDVVSTAQGNNEAMCTK